MIEVLPLYASHKGDYSPGAHLTLVPRRELRGFNFGLAALSSIIG